MCPLVVPLLLCSITLLQGTSVRTLVTLWIRQTRVQFLHTCTYTVLQKMRREPYTLIVSAKIPDATQSTVTGLSWFKVCMRIPGLTTHGFLISHGSDLARRL